MKNLLKLNELLEPEHKPYEDPIETDGSISAQVKTI